MLTSLSSTLQSSCAVLYLLPDKHVLWNEDVTINTRFHLAPFHVTNLPLHLTPILSKCHFFFQTNSVSNVMDMTSVYNNIPIYPSSAGWNYNMRRNMQEIIPGVFLGPYSAAQRNCRSLLLDKGISYIICVRQDKEAHFIKPQFNDPNFTYLTLDIADIATENIIRFFSEG